MNQIPVGGRKSLPPQRIVRLQADRNYPLIHQADGSTLLVSITLKVIETRLQPYGFIRITRGVVINPHFVQKICKDSTVQLIDGTQIYPSRRRKGALKDKINENSIQHPP